MHSLPPGHREIRLPRRSQREVVVPLLDHPDETRGWRRSGVSAEQADADMRNPLPTIMGEMTAPESLAVRKMVVSDR